MEADILEVSIETAAKLGLTNQEFESIKRLLNRDPDWLELCVFASIWEERSSYKSSRTWLKTLPSHGKRVIEENGLRLLDIGDGLACAVKMNASQLLLDLDPGIGATKILSDNYRQLYAKGIRPLGVLNGLRIGSLKGAEVKSHFESLLNASSHYNSILGIPNLKWDTYFHESYQQKVLFGSLSFGVKKYNTQSNNVKPSLIGKQVFLLGAPTRLEGTGPVFQFLNDSTAIKGISLLAQKDSLYEKCLLEACLEMDASNLILAMEGVGANGMLSAGARLSKENDIGIAFDLTEFQNNQEVSIDALLMLSESPARILLIVEEEQVNTIKQVCEKWDIELLRIGSTNADRKIRFLRGGNELFALHSDQLIPGREIEVLQKPQKKPSYIEKGGRFNLKKIPHAKNYKNLARKISKSANTYSKKWLLEGLDSSLFAQNITFNNPSDACLIKLDGTNKVLALSIGGNANYIKSDPYSGVMSAVAEATRNIVISGGVPLGLVSGFHFGDPDNPNVYWQFVQMIKGINDACRKFSLPVIDTDVSFFHQNIQKNGAIPVFPSPIIGVIGTLENPSEQVTFGFKEEGHLIYMIGTPTNDMNASEFLKIVHNNPASPSPVFDLDEAYHIQLHLKKLIRRGLIESAHDIMEGGLFMALLECAIVNDYGFNVESDNNFRKDAYLFGESQSRILISIDPDREDDLVNYLNAQNVPFTRLGEVEGDELIIDDESYGPLKEWKINSEKCLEKTMED